jgi:hypothetical protein
MNNIIENYKQNINDIVINDNRIIVGNKLLSEKIDVAIMITPISLESTDIVNLFQNSTYYVYNDILTEYTLFIVKGSHESECLEDLLGDITDDDPRDLEKIRNYLIHVIFSNIMPDTLYVILETCMNKSFNEGRIKEREEIMKYLQ